MPCLGKMPEGRGGATKEGERRLEETGARGESDRVILQQLPSLVQMVHGVPETSA